MPGIFEIVYNWQNFCEKKSRLSGEALDMMLYSIIQKWISVTNSLRIDFEITKHYILYSLLFIFYYPLYSPGNPKVNMKCLLSIKKMVFIFDGCSYQRERKIKTYNWAFIENNSDICDIALNDLSNSWIFLMTNKILEGVWKWISFSHEKTKLKKINISKE